ncbi:MAG: tryptophan synthase subunit alpha [Nitrospirae bacterium]|nr:tryptophan synthase subunit alpha [Nitrospirota bacterium]
MIRTIFTNKKAFIPYIMAGDISLQKTEDIVLLLEDCGADIIELGVPFTDPLADGPTIQHAAERAILNGVTLKKVMEMVHRLRNKTKVPIVLMTYLNPVYKYGLVRFPIEAVSCGVNGVIIPDLPADMEGEFINDARKHKLDTIFFVAPTSTLERIKLSAKKTTGFLYYVSITGITGSNINIDSHMTDMIGKIRAISNLPIAVGFGVKTPEQAASAAQIADGVIIGSSIVSMMNDNSFDLNELKKYLISLRKAIKFI